MGDAKQEMASREEFCDHMRNDIEKMKAMVAMEVNANGKERLCVPNSCSFVEGREDAENLILVYRHLEDARMRLGKVMQALQGGVSILDKKPSDEEGPA